MKRLVKALIEGDAREAREHAEVFPPVFGGLLLNKRSELTDFGLRQAMEYPFPRKLGGLLVGCYVGEVCPKQICEIFPDFNRVFRLANRKQARLTETGLLRAVLAMPLKLQCETLGIGFETISLNQTKACVEERVAASYRNDEFLSVNLEGGDFFVLLRCAAWSEFQWVMAGSGTPYLEAMIIDAGNPSKRNRDAARSLLRGIRASSITSVKEAFNMLYPGSSLAERYPGLSGDYISSLYRSLGVDCLYRIAEVFVEDPYQFRKGWPDVTVVPSARNVGRGMDGLILREVKVGDKLHISQIITIRRLVKLLPDVGVTKVKYLGS